MNEDWNYFILRYAELVGTKDAEPARERLVERIKESHQQLLNELEEGVDKIKENSQNYSMEDLNQVKSLIQQTRERL